MIFRFLTFELDAARRELQSRGKPVAMSPKAFDVLCYLIENRDRMVRKTELLDAFWSRDVSEAALHKTVSVMRKAIAIDTPAADIVQTQHGLGLRFLPDVVEIADRSETGDPATAAPLREQRVVAVLCVRFRRAGEGSPSLQALLRQSRLIVHNHQGAVLHDTPHGFTAEFGLAQGHEIGARLAIHCAVALAEASGRKTIACGMDVGAVEFGARAGPNDKPRRAGVERAAEERAATAGFGDILLGEGMLTQLSSEIRTRPTAGGHLLISVEQRGPGVPGRPLARPTGFVGRAAEMAFLSSCIDTLESGSGQVVVLSGPAGIGKTRLTSEFLASLEGSPLEIVEIQCLPASSQSPLSTIRALCLGLITDDLRSSLADSVDIALLDAVLDTAAQESGTLAHLSDHQRRQRSYALVMRLLRSACRDRAIVVVIEDVHWMDTTSREYVDAIEEQIDDIRLLILATTRPRDGQPFAETTLTLSPLNQKDSVQILTESLGEASLPHSQATELVRRAAGNPFFIEELALAAQSGRDAGTELPETVQAVIALRIGALEPEARALLYVIAVIGPPARPALVRHLLERSGEAVDSTAALLRSAGFLRVEPSGYAFRHMLIGETAYSMISPPERQRLHARVAAFLEASAKDRPTPPERLAWHHQEAGNRDAALSYWLDASRDALRRTAMSEAVGFARHGLDLVPAKDTKQARRALDLELCLAPALTALHGFGAEDVGAAYRRARELSRVAGTTKSDIRVLVGLWIHSWVRGRLDESLDHAQRLLEIAARANDPALKLQAHASLGQVLMHKGDLPTALTHLTTALDALGDTVPATLPAQNAATSCAAYAAWVCSLTGRERDAQVFLDRSRYLSRVFDNPFADAIHHALCALPLMSLGEVDRCLEMADRAVDISREHNFAFWLGTGLVTRGWALGQKGEIEAAYEAVDDGIAVFEGTGARVQLANWYGFKAEVALAAGDTELGLSSAQQALEHAQGAKDLHFAPRIHATLSRLYRDSQTPARADEAIRDALAMAARFGMTRSFLGLASGV